MEWIMLISPQKLKVEPGPSPLTWLPILAERKPVIGYHGALARWFDYELFERVALIRQDLNFVLIGPDVDGQLAGTAVC
jgi:hypothetical protein